MPKTELKPTTREERERWKEGHKFQPTDQSYTILRLIADVERLRTAAWAFGKTVEGIYGYLQHDVHCEIEPTDYCTCGLREAKQGVHDAWEALNDD